MCRGSFPTIVGPIVTLATLIHVNTRAKLTLASASPSDNFIIAQPKTTLLQTLPAVKDD